MSDQPLNVYQKIQKVRNLLVQAKLKKTGKNSFSNFTYYELGDFVPTLNRLMDENGIMTKFSLYYINGKEQAVLKVFDSAKPTDHEDFIIPTAEVEIGRKKDGTGGAEPIQNLGGKITYLRRYLHQIAFEIVEGDSVDSPKPPVELDDDSVAKINACKTMDELAQVCKDLTAKKGAKFRKAIVELYTAKKEELGDVNS
jgi:hypothetical protein